MQKRKISTLRVEIFLRFERNEKREPFEGGVQKARRVTR